LHFSELVSQRIGYDLYNIARGGMSNGGIIAQLEFALTFNPDLLIYNSTSSDRIEFPIQDNSGIKLDASHISYPYASSTSSGLKFLNRNNRMISEHLYCPRWKSQTDTLLFYAISHQIFSRGTKFIFMADALRCIPEIKWLEEQNIGYSYETLIPTRNAHIAEEFGHENFNDPGYHTTTRTQREIAEFTLEKIGRLGI